MIGIMDKVKEKTITKDIKDAIADNAKDVVDTTKGSISLPIQTSSFSSSYFTPNPTFTSSSITYVPNIEKDNSDIKSKNVDSLLIGQSENEQKTFSTNIKENNTIKN